MHFHICVYGSSLPLRSAMRTLQSGFRSVGGGAVPDDVRVLQGREHLASTLFLLLMHGNLRQIYATLECRIIPKKNTSIMNNTVKQYKRYLSHHQQYAEVE